MTDTSPANRSIEPVAITLPYTGSKALLRAFVPGRMRVAARGVFLREMKVDSQKAEAAASTGVAPTEEQAREVVEMGQISGTAIDEINEITVKHMVLSIDGDANDVLNRALDLPDEDYDYIIEKCNEIDKATSVDDTKKKS